MLAMNLSSSSMNPHSGQPPPQSHVVAQPAFLSPSNSIGSASSAFSAPSPYNPFSIPQQQQHQQSSGVSQQQQQQQHAPQSQRPLSFTCLEAESGKRGREPATAATTTPRLPQPLQTMTSLQIPPASLQQPQLTPVGGTVAAIHLEQEQQPTQSTKRRRHSEYRPPVTVPVTFTSVTGSLAGGMRRNNLSFNQIDPYVSYAQTPSLFNSNNNNDSVGMDMDTMGSSQNNPGTNPSSFSDNNNNYNRVRSMSF